ncbi:MAG: SPFH domain-containing protein [Candidatus Heimdallarchaeaceae archaeon]
MTFLLKLTKVDEKKGNIIKSERTIEDIAWVFPDAIEDWEKKLKLKNMNQIIVKNTESAVIYEFEEYKQSITNGVYRIDRKEGAKGLKIIFLVSSKFDIKWGIPQQQGPLTSDTIKIGLSGEISISISSPETFCQNLLKESPSLSLQEIKPKINNLIRETMREVISQYSVEELQKVGKDELTIMVVPTLIDSFMRLGLLAENFSLSGLGIPPEFHI